MGRRILYRIEENGRNAFTEDEWSELERLQHWYNSEFAWSTGKIRFKRYIVFPNAEDFSGLDIPFTDLLARRRTTLLGEGRSEREAIAQMEREHLLIVKWGGYVDGSLASGFTRVADNEWNAFLVCDFLLKASTLIPKCSIIVQDEGQFIKSGSLAIMDAAVMLRPDNLISSDELKDLCQHKRVFSVVDPEKYRRHPAFRNMIPEYTRLKALEKRDLVRNWNWLGYDGKFDANGDDLRGYDLNDKVRAFSVVE